jgi:putative membrane protein
MKYILPALMAVLALGWLVSPSDARMRMKHPPMSTEQFVMKAASANQFEIESSQLALQKSNNDQIKQFAHRMIEDHTKIGDQMKEALQKANIQAPPPQLDPMDEAQLKKLKNLSGAAFDRTYVADQRKGHIQTVRLLEGYSKLGDNQVVKQMAEQTLPIVKEHLKFAEALSAGRNVSARR